MFHQYRERKLEKKRVRKLASKLQKANCQDKISEVIESIESWSRRQGLASRRQGLQRSSEMKDDYNDCVRGFSHLSRAWYGKSCLANYDYVDEITIGMFDEDGDSCGSFHIRWIELGWKVYPELGAFSDSWPVVALFMDLIVAISKTSDESETPQEICKLLESLGIKDFTKTVDPDKKPKNVIDNSPQNVIDNSPLQICKDFRKVMSAHDRPDLLELIELLHRADKAIAATEDVK